MRSSQFVNFARKYRPNQFSEVIGQTSVVSTLKNALRMQRVGAAYLFCGTRGSGKTTLARLLSKALNCPNLSAEAEPCNQCTSCQDISFARCLDVIEIDGASNRGIDDIRSINETVYYAPSSAKYKIYLIDEVHMLTKEAFNALLKTLEEPPPHVKFFFATTEPHKLPATITSRCQRFDLKSLKIEEIVQSLVGICEKEGLEVQKAALQLVAKCADGSLRDAQSLFDLVVCSLEPPFAIDALSTLLGLVPSEELAALDQAIFDVRLDFAFAMTNKLFEKGCDYLQFTSQLLEHFRCILHAFFSPASSHAENARLYSKAQLLYIIDQIVLFLQKIPPSGFSKIYLEALLLKILRSRNQLSFDVLTDKLLKLENRLHEPNLEPAPVAVQTPISEPCPVLVEISEPVPPINEAFKMRATYDTILHFTKEVLEGTLKK